MLPLYQNDSTEFKGHPSDSQSPLSQYVRFLKVQWQIHPLRTTVTGLAFFVFCLVLFSNGGLEVPKEDGVFLEGRKREANLRLENEEVVYGEGDNYVKKEYLIDDDDAEVQGNHDGYYDEAGDENAGGDDDNDDENADDEEIDENDDNEDIDENAGDDDNNDDENADEEEIDEFIVDEKDIENEGDEAKDTVEGAETIPPVDRNQGNIPLDDHKQINKEGKKDPDNGKDEESISLPNANEMEENINLDMQYEPISDEEAENRRTQIKQLFYMLGTHTKRALSDMTS